MGSIVKGVASLFGGGKRRRAEASAAKGFEGAEANVENREFQNAYGDLTAGSYTPGQYTPGTATGGTLGGPQGVAQGSTLGDAQGYTSQGYTSQGYQGQGYSAQGTSIGGLARGADTGLTNTMSNLQVSTAGSELAAQEADQSLAASQDLAAQAGTGAGGATALAAAAAKSKAGISADIDRQVKSNEMMRAKGEGELQRAQLAQGNLSSQFDLGQSQFNVGSQNKAAQFGAQAQNQANQFTAGQANTASQFGAQAANQAAKFGAQANNQFALTQFGADERREQFNMSNINRNQQMQFQSDNKFELANTQFANRGQEFNIGNQIGADRFAQESLMRNSELGAQGQMRVQDMEYGRDQDTLNRRAGEYQATKDARAAAKGDLIGGIAGIADIAAMGLTGGASGAGSFKTNFAKNAFGG
tara:strand:+ start:686 stop:1933 length:1248 start_codon:yes stop_codon:yes gene_type:complete